MGLRKEERQEKEFAELTFNRIFEAHYRDVYRLAFHLTQNKEDAEDLFQDTWLRVTRNLSRIALVRDVKAWIFTIAMNRFRDQLRKKKWRSIMRLNPDSEHGAAAGNPNPDWRLSLSQAIANLPPKLRIVFVLKEMEGFKYEEISRMLGKPIGTVKTLQHRALLQLREELK